MLILTIVMTAMNLHAEVVALKQLVREMDILKFFQIRFNLGGLE
jgi:hypothetical protein